MRTPGESRRPGIRAPPVCRDRRRRPPIARSPAAIVSPRRYLAYFTELRALREPLDDSVRRRPRRGLMVNEIAAAARIDILSTIGQFGAVRKNVAGGLKVTRPLRDTYQRCRRNNGRGH